MSFGQELKDFSAVFGATYTAMADRRDKKWQRERQALNDPIDREYKTAATESMKKHTAWYDKIADLQQRTGEKNLEWADRKNQSAIDANDASIYANVFGTRRSSKPAETLDGTPPEGEPDVSGAPVGDHGDVGATVDDSTTDTTPDASEDTSGDDTSDAGDDASVEQMSYKPASSQGEVYARFMRTVYDSGVKNPNGLAAIAATANRESKFAPQHAYGRWADPSESGQAGTAGGIMSWRGNRYVGLQHFAAKLGDDPARPSPETQAKYLFHEDPGLKDRLNQARTPREAQHIMNQAWAFAGYDRPGGETAARMSLADQYAEKYGQYLANGGLVRPQRAVYAAVGGVIPEDPNAQEQAPMQALPVDNPPVPTPRPMDQPAPDTSEGNKPDVGYNPAVAANPRVVGFTKAHEAVLDGMRYSLQQMGIGGPAAVTDPDRAAKMAEYLKGAGAAPRAVIDQAYDAVDPDHKLPESERTMAALGMVYDHYTRRGESAKAKAAAASIVQYQRKLFQQYSSIAKAAIADGDIDAATKAAVKAYSSVPDGQDMKVKKLEDGRYQIDITDEATGNTISKPVLTPQEIGGWAMKVSPGSFDQFIMDAAGVRKQGGGPPSEDFQKLSAGIDEGKLPSNKDMANLPLSEQKELRMRITDYNKTQSAGGAKPATFSETTKMRDTMNTKFDELAQETTQDADGNEVPVINGMDKLSPFDRKTVVHAAADIVASPHNRSADYNVSEEDAIIAGLAVSKTMDYKAVDKDGGKLVTLPDDRQVWMPKSHFNQLTNVYKRTIADEQKKVSDAQKAQDESAAKSAERAARDKKNREEGPGLLGNQAVPPPTMGRTPQSALDDLEKLMGQ